MFVTRLRNWQHGPALQATEVKILWQPDAAPPTAPPWPRLRRLWTFPLSAVIVEEGAPLLDFVLHENENTGMINLVGLIFRILRPVARLHNVVRDEPLGCTLNGCSNHRAVAGCAYRERFLVSGWGQPRRR